MEEEKKYKISSVVPGNYKYGKYLLNLYKKVDFAILVITTLLSLAAFFELASTDNLNMNSFIVLMILGSIPFLLTLPIQGYFNLYTYLFIRMKHHFTNNTYVWKGVNYGEEYEETTEEDSEDN